MKKDLADCDDTLSLKSGAECEELNTYERPTSLRMCLFQLSESNDINRVTIILDTLTTKSKDTLQQMRKKYNLNHKVISILKKYCNAEYGFDHVSSRKGQF